MDHLEEIRSRIAIEELVGSYVQLKKAGRNLRGLCPFHNEKTPSFMVSPEKGICYCFGCHQGGDIFKFIQLTESVDFGEAVKMLAEKAGVKLPRFNPESQNKRLRTIEANEAATRFFQNELNKTTKALDYLKNRGLLPETIQKFKLGFAPDSFDALRNTLTREGFSEAELIEAGLINQKSIADRSTYDRFRNRLMIPLTDHQGSVVGFTGRIIDEGEPKYMNSPDTPAYNKSSILYGLNFAKDAIKEKDQAILVEGNMDVITSHQAGVVNVVAASGTALTPLQLKLLKRFTKKIALAFDQDDAGLNATMRSIELAQIAEMDIKVIQVPEGKDPDECIRKSPESWQSAATSPISIMDFYFNYAGRRFDPETMEGKKGFLGLLLPIIKLYSSEMEQGEYLNRLALVIKTDVKLLWNDLKKTQKKGLVPEVAESSLSQTQKIFSREEFLLGFIFKHPETYDFVFKNLIDNIGFDASTEAVYKTLKNLYTPESSFNASEIRTHFTPEIQAKIDILSLLIDDIYPDFSDEAAYKEVIALVAEINRRNLKSIQKEYEFKIRGATEEGEKRILLNQYNQILKLITHGQKGS